MYIAFIGAAIGALIGWYRAGKLGGNKLDRLQYGAAHAIGFGLLGLTFALILGWLVW